MTASNRQSKRLVGFVASVQQCIIQFQGKLLVKYAENSHYNLGNPGQRTAFVNWSIYLAAHPAAGNTSGAINPGGKPVNQLACLVQNLNAELDYSKGNVTDFRLSLPSEGNLASG